MDDFGITNLKSYNCIIKEVRRLLTGVDLLTLFYFK